MKRRRAPSHPGGILKRLYLQPLSLSTLVLAKAVGVSRKTISKLVNERGAVTPEMALRLSIAFKTTPQLWLNLQHNYDLWHVRRKAKGLKRVRRLAA
jgi:addiction module HigA family antidote